MALRKILTEGDEQLLKHSRKVEKFDDRLHTLIDDMRRSRTPAALVWQHRRWESCAALLCCWM